MPSDDWSKKITEISGELKPGSPNNSDPSIKSPDIKTEFERKTLETDKLKLEIKQLEDDVVTRRRYSKNIFHLIIWWISFIGAILLLQGLFGHEDCVFFYLDDKVITAAIGGTTAGILGIFIIIVRNLFPNKDGKDLR